MKHELYKKDELPPLPFRAFDEEYRVAHNEHDVYDGAGNVIAEICCPYPAPLINLIVSAPDLLRGLEWAVALLKELGQDYDLMFEMCEKTIEEARGKKA